MISMLLEAHEENRLQHFVAELLRHEDALVEPIEPEGLEVLAPPGVQRALGIGELSRLGFGTTLPFGAQRVGLEGDWLDRFARLLGPRGRWSRRVLSAQAKVPNDPERMLGHELVLDNATFRLLGATPAWTRYLIMDFRASAVSDDKRDFITRLGVNLATGALPDAVITALGPFLDQTEADPEVLPSETELPAMWDRASVVGLVGRALPPRLNVALDPFVKGLRRRLSRDQDRLHRYHDDLYHEAMRRALALPKGDPKRLREEQRTAAIEREYRAKLDDLARQYATKVTVEWVQTLELAMPVHRFDVRIRRRKGERTIALDWNPVARRLELPICEATAGMERPRLVCDDALHLVVPAGLAPCTVCGRVFCRACHPAACPKCGPGV
jgi:hypothetical protein